MDLFADRVREQLRAEKAFYKYDYGDSAYDPYLTDQLVSILTDLGINDIRNIARFEGLVPMAPTAEQLMGEATPGGVIDATTGILWQRTVFFYNALTGARLNIERSVYDASGAGGESPAELAASADGDVFAIRQSTHTPRPDWQFLYIIKYLPDNTPYFVVRMLAINRGHTFLQTIAPVLPVVMVALAIFVPGAGLAIGSAIMGSVGAGAAAVAYPAVAAAIGNIAISAAVNGGDIERAVVNGLAGGLGGVAGGYVATASQIPAMGVAASAAVSTFVRDRDADNIGRSVGMSLLSYAGAPAAPAQEKLQVEFDYAFGGEVATDYGLPDDLFAGSFLPDELGAGFTADYAFGGDIYAGYGGGASGDPYNADPSYSSTGTDYLYGGSTVPGYSSIPAAESGGFWDSFSWESIVDGAASAAVAAIKVNQAWQASQRPSSGVGPRPSSPPGTRVSPSGRTATGGLPPVGAVNPTSDGRYVINNGDGTYTLIDSTGTSTRRSYAGAGVGAGAVDTNTMMLWGAGILGAAFLLRKRR